MTPLHTKRLVLRNFNPDDFAAVHSYASIPEFSRFEAWGPNSVEDTKKYIADMMTQASIAPRWKFDLAITLADSGKLIGGCGLRREFPESLVANLGWAVSPEQQNQGYATEIACELIRFGFDTLRLKVIYATCDALNTASFRVMQKAGMKLVGLVKNEREQKGQKRDTFRYEIYSK
jgi:ribosomal-protein-alanine N-acetyltransferase